MLKRCTNEMLLFVGEQWRIRIKRRRRLFSVRTTRYGGQLHRDDTAVCAKPSYGARVAPMEWLISTVCTSMKLLNTQSRHFSRPYSGTTKSSASSSVRLLSKWALAGLKPVLMVDSYRFRQGITCEGWQGEDSASVGKIL